MNVNPKDYICLRGSYVWVRLINRYCVRKHVDRFMAMVSYDVNI